MRHHTRHSYVISSMMDLCAEIDRLAGSETPQRNCREIGLEFHNRGYRDYHTDAAPFIEEIFSDKWIWGSGGPVVNRSTSDSDHIASPRYRRRTAADDAALCNEVYDQCGSVKRECHEIVDKFRDLGFSSYQNDAPAFIDEVCSSGWAEGEDDSSHYHRTERVSSLRRRHATKQMVVQVYIDPASADMDPSTWKDLCWTFQASLNNLIQRGEQLGSKLYTDGFTEGSPPSFEDGFTLQAVVSGIDAEIVERLVGRLAASHRYVDLGISMDSWPA